MYGTYALVPELTMENATDVRRHWRAHLDRAAARLPVAFSRGEDAFAVVDASLHRDLLRRSVPAPVVVAEDDGWSIFLDGYPVAADGRDLDEAIDDFLVSVTDYATAWVDRLHTVPNHQHAVALVHLVAISTDEQLREWVGSSTKPSLSV
jgi:hypothetical protein